MSALTNLFTLDLSNNLLTGSLPSGFAKLSNINEFLVAKNRFVGDIFPIALHWRNMTHLDIEDTDLGGAIPTEIGLLTNLTYFETRFSKVRGSIPTEIAKLTKLRQLLIDGPLFEGTLPDEIGRMTELGK
jgi:Leucine-rich repeat (LRR) protein